MDDLALMLLTGLQQLLWSGAAFLRGLCSTDQMRVAAEKAVMGDIWAALMVFTAGRAGVVTQSKEGLTHKKFMLK